MELEAPPGGTILDDSQLEPPPGGTILKDDVGAGQVDPQLRDIAIALARHIFGGGDAMSALKASAGMVPGIAEDLIKKTIKPDAETAKGLAQGAARIPAAPDASTDETIANKFGRAALPAAGALAAGAAVGPAAGLLASAGAVGAGAGAGDAASMALAKAAGGEAPATIAEGAKTAAKTGLEAAVTDLGLGALFKGVAAVAPKAVAMFKSFPSESLKRTLERPEQVLSVIESAPKGGAQVAAEVKATKALREVQNGLSMARNAAGKEVENALEGFHIATKGAKVADIADAAEVGAEALAARTTSEGVSTMTAAEEKKVVDLIKQMREAGPQSARDLIKWRRKLDNLIDFKRGSVPEVTSGEAQSIVSTMARRLREQIGEAADAAGYAKLAEANAKFSGLAKSYDAYRPSFSTKTVSSKEAVRKLEGLSRDYNKGGLTQQELTELGDKFPMLRKSVDDLLDSLVARQFTLETRGSPSGLAMMAIRQLAGPGGLSTAAKLRGGRGNAVRKGAAALSAGIGGSLNQ